MYQFFPVVTLRYCRKKNPTGPREHFPIGCNAIIKVVLSLPHHASVTHMIKLANQNDAGEQQNEQQQNNVATSRLINLLMCSTLLSPSINSLFKQKKHYCDIQWTHLEQQLF